MALSGIEWPLLLLFLLGLAGNHEQKMFHNEQKMFALKIAPNCKESDEIIWSYADCALYELAWPRGIYCGLVWPFVVLYGIFWSCMVFCGLVWYFMALLWSFIAKY